MKWITVLVLLLLLTAGRLWATTDHTSLIQNYEGTKTCLACHEQAGKEVAQSLHYQQQAGAKFLKGLSTDTPVGMMASY